MSSLTIVALASATFAALILITYLVRRPVLDATTKLWLLAGVGILPIITAATGNVQGYYQMKERSFCGSCHVMTPHANDSGDPNSKSLASRHARNKLFGEDNCYACHSDYGMYGTVTTKIGGMGHVWYYYTEYRNTPLEEAKKTIHLKKPFPNENCMQCHSTELAVWNDVPVHKSSLEDVRSGKMSCASGGCHGFAHPFSKPEEDQRAADDALAKNEQRKAAARKALVNATVDAGAPQ